MKKPSGRLNLIAVTLTLVLGVWAVATIHLQTELLPLFPAKYASVRGVRQSLSVLSSAQELTVILTKPAATADIADRLQNNLQALPEVQAISVIGQPKMEPIVKMAAWVVANLPPEKFAEFQQLFTEKEMDSRLQDTRDQLAGAVDPGQVMLLRMDPLQMLPWLQAQPHQSLPLPDFSANEAPSVIVMQLRARGPLRTFEQCQDFVGRVRRVIDDTVGPTSPDIRQAIIITGQPAYVAENSAQMRSDMTVMVLLATGLTSLVLWLCYRSRSALVWMTVVLALALLAGAIVARLLFGELNVISIGFSSILIGLGSDYCILVYHFYALRDEDIPGRDIAGDWRRTRRGIWLSATATTLAFGTLYFSSFPGLQQLVVLIGAGLLATAFFATTLLSDILQRKRPVMPAWLMTTSDAMARWQERQRRRIIFGVVAGLVLVAGLWPLVRGYKFYDPDFNRLRPAHSEADRGVQLLMKTLQSRKTFDVIVSSPSWDELRAKAGRVTQDATLLPQADYYAVNRAKWKPGREAAFKAVLDKAGFEESWGAATLLLLNTMDAWAGGTEDFQSARLFLSNVVELPGGQKLALLRLPMQDGGLRAMWEQVKQREPTSLPASWQLMIDDLQRGVLQDARTLSLWMLVAIVLVCWWASRSLAQAALNGLALVVTTVLFLALLWATRQSMTLHSLLTVPVMVAVAIEYSLYILLSLRASTGDLHRTFRQLAVPVLLMGLTSIIGFGAPVATHQPALQNFGLMMAMGTFAAMMTGIVVVPAFYSSADRRPHYSQTLYRAFWFDLAERCAGTAGRGAARAMGACLGWLYAVTHPNRGKAVRANLSLLSTQPVVGKLVRRTFTNYGRTLADYFLIGTLPKPEALALARERVGVEHLKEVFNKGQGALLVTAHLGLFEYGSLLMEEIGRPTVVVTLPEPSPALSEWRAQFRKRWGADTYEVGTDNFSFVEITRHLAQGRCVAMLMDRPYDGRCAPVDFPNGAVAFSTGPVWLSLLSGSPIIVVTVVALPGGGYRVEAHPPIRPQWLPEGRDQTVQYYTKQVAAVFRETICQYPDQWYQFIDLSARR